jgi:uncharacterized protein YcbX
MKVTALYVYPIKAIRGIRLDEAQLGPQGVRYDRTFMLCRVAENGELQRMQLSQYPQCSLFAQDIVGDTIHVQYMSREQKPMQLQLQPTLEVPLQPDVGELDRSDVNLHQSLVSAYRMGPRYDAWFSAHFGFETALLYIGDAKRPVLGTFSPQPQLETPQAGWFSSISTYLPASLGARPSTDPNWLTFTDMAPLLVTTEASLRIVSTMLSEGDMDMYKFRPNIVVDGEVEWDEDFWAGLALDGRPILTMSKMCNRCTSLNVDYDTGRVAEGERGIVLKKLMKDRRVDLGWKYNPVFGRYAFLHQAVDQVVLKIDDVVSVTERLQKRPAFDWPIKDAAAARFY